MFYVVMVSNSYMYGDYYAYRHYNEIALTDLTTKNKQSRTLYSRS